jgi:hypothetical protein
MIFWSLYAFIWFTNIEKMLLQMTSGFLQLESTILWHLRDAAISLYGPIVTLYNSDAKL